MAKYITSNIVNMTATSSDSTNIYYLTDFGEDYETCQAPTVAEKQSHDGVDPIAWLRQRVDEVCFRPGA